MALQGNLRDFAATEILQLVGSQNKTGCLMLEWGTERSLVYVQEGRIVSTRQPGMSKDDPLLGFLLHVHRLSDEQYQGLLTIQRESKRDLEDLLINGRYLDREELAGFVERQILDDLMRITRWENGSYRFDPNNRWPNTPLVSMNIEGALIEAARRVDEQKRFVSVFRDPYQVLGLCDLPDPDEPLYEEVRELFGIIDGQHTIAEILEAASLSEYETYEALHQMLESNWIEVVGRRDPGKGGAPEPAPHRLERRRTKKPFIFVREIALAALIAGAALGIHHLTGLMVWNPVNNPEEDIFVAARLQQIELSLDLYALEHGRYPESLGTLVDEQWLPAGHLDLPGTTLRYEPAVQGDAYDLTLQKQS